MKSLKMKKNRKGMTLVEVVVAMTLLGIASTMIVMSLATAVDQNRKNYYRAQDVDAEGIAAESFNVNQEYTAENARVQVNKMDGSSNKVVLEADFGGGNTFTMGNVYAYKSKLPGNSNSVKYQLQFFQSMYNKCADPANGDYWILFYNDSSTEISSFQFTGAADAYLYDSQNQKFTVANPGDAPCTAEEILPSGGKTGVGFNINTSGVYLTTSNGFTLNASNLENYKEKDANGEDTGMVIVHCTDGGFLTQEEFDNGST